MYVITDLVMSRLKKNIIMYFEKRDLFKKLFKTKIKAPIYE